MKRYLLLTLFSAVFFCSLTAALPPLYQNLTELKAVLNAPELTHLLNSGEVIVQIYKVDSGYLIMTDQHSLIAKVVFEHAIRPGPTPFHIEFSKPQPNSIDE